MPFKIKPALYSVWDTMRQRCRNPNATQFSDYGGRGVSICAAWEDYATFERDMSPRPSGTTIDRINNDEGYSPENCRWATRKEQQRNRRCARYVTIEGDRHLVAALAERSGLKADTILARVKSGLSFAGVMSPDRRFGYDPETLAQGAKKSAEMRAARTHCKRGHEYTPENTRKRPDGGRDCRACHNAKMRKRNAAKAIEHPAAPELQAAQPSPSPAGSPA